MKAITLTITMSLVPAMLMAQVSGQAQATSRATVKAPAAASEARTSATARENLHVPKRFSAGGKAALEAMYTEAKEHDVPREPISRRVAEGEAKGASEAAILASAGKVKLHMEETHEAMVRGGRDHPSAAECERGAMLMEHGVTAAQIEAMAKGTPKGRSLVVAFDVLGRLAARGEPVTQAVAQVQAKLDGRASDAALLAMAGKAAAGVSMGVGANARATAGANAAAGVTATVNGAATAAPKGTTAGVTGVVNGALKKP